MLQLAETMCHNRTITILGLQANADINDGVITKFVQIIGWHPTLKQITLDATNVSWRCTTNVVQLRLDRVHDQRARVLVMVVATMSYHASFCESKLVTLPKDLMLKRID